jgi:hypothetical protein
MTGSEPSGEQSPSTGWRGVYAEMHVSTQLDPEEREVEERR